MEHSSTTLEETQPDRVAEKIEAYDRYVEKQAAAKVRKAEANRRFAAQSETDRARWESPEAVAERAEDSARWTAKRAEEAQAAQTKADTLADRFNIQTSVAAEKEIVWDGKHVNWPLSVLPGDALISAADNDIVILETNDWALTRFGFQLDDLEEMTMTQKPITTNVDGEKVVTASRCLVFRPTAHSAAQTEDLSVLISRKTRHHIRDLADIPTAFTLPTIPDRLAEMLFATGGCDTEGGVPTALPGTQLELEQSPILSLEMIERSVDVEPAYEVAGISLGYKGDLTGLFGKTNVGKTMSGLAVAGESGLRTIYILTEQHRRIYDRAKAIGNPNITFAQLEYGDNERLNRLIALKPELVVIDPLVGMVEVEDNASSMKRTFDWLRPLTDQCYNLIIHHVNKGGMEARGSGVYSDTCANTYRVEPDGTNGCKVSVVKNKDGRNGLSLNWETGKDGKLRFGLNPPPVKPKTALRKMRLEWDGRPLTKNEMVALAAEVMERSRNEMRPVVNRIIEKGMVETKAVRGGSRYKLS